MKKLNRVFPFTLVLAACLFAVSCTKSSSDGVSPAGIQPSEVESSEAQVSSGVQVMSHDVAAVEVLAGQTSAGELAKTLEEIYVAYPILAARSALLGSITRVVETDAGTLDLYAGETLVLILAWDANNSIYTVRSSSAEFMADSITRNTTAANALESLNFVTSDCRTVEQEQDQDQGKEEPKEESYCASLEVELTLEEIVEQEQEQEEPKQKEPKQEEPKQEEPTQEKP